MVSEMMYLLFLAKPNSVVTVHRTIIKEERDDPCLLVSSIWIAKKSLENSTSSLFLKPLKILPTDKKKIQAFIMNDPDKRNGTYKYFIEDNDGNRTFTSAGGTYAVFTNPWETLADIDHFIGACYGELYQTIEYDIGGTTNIQLLDFEHKKNHLKTPCS